MSDSETYADVTVTAEGVRVTKAFEPEDFPVPAIAFEFASDRDEPVTVELVDEVPSGVSANELGFHPEYGSEHWTIDDGRLVFERELEPGETYTTVYGIRATGTDAVEQFLSDPVIERVEPPLSTEPMTDSADETVADVIPETTPSESDFRPKTESAEEDIEPIELTDPAQSPPAEPVGSAPGPDPSRGEFGGTVVAQLAREIREDEAPPEDVKLLREAFEIAGQRGGSITARVDRLQEDVSKLRAYTDALEEFLDEHGTGQQILDGFRSDIADVEAQLSEIDDRVSANDEEVAAVRDEMDGVRSDVASNRAAVDDVEDTLDGLPADVADVRSEVTNLGEDVDLIWRELGETQRDFADLLEDVEAVEDDVGELRSSVDGMADEMTAVRSQVQAVEERVDDLADEMADRDEARAGLAEDLSTVDAELDDLGRSVAAVESALDDLRGTVATIEADMPTEDIDDRLQGLERDLADLREWQTKLKNTFAE